MIEQRPVFDRIREAWEVMRERDYQTNPRDGYRALHIVVRVQGRAVEVQVRTELEDLWANASEALAKNIDPEIKYGGGPAGVRGLLDRAAATCGRMDSLEAQRRQIKMAGYPVSAEWGSGVVQLAAEMRAVLRATATIRRDVDSGEFIADMDATDWQTLFAARDVSGGTNR